VALLAEDADDFLLSLLPQGVSPLKRLFAGGGEPHQPRPAVLSGPHLQQTIPNQWLEVSA
jgi:hypothetical protein